MRRTSALMLVVLALACAASPQAESDRLRVAKALFFDREYARAREAWQEIHARGRGPEAQAALYWIARCSEGLGESERALSEYGEFLAARPVDRMLDEEARTSRVALAVKLAKGGQPKHLPLARQALEDRSRVVRYFAGLQVCSLGPETGRAAVPVLKEILAREKDEDLVDRAKLCLLRVDPAALAVASPPPVPPRAARQASWIRVRIYQKGTTVPAVSINLPVALAEMVFKSLPADARAELQKKGYDADSFWDRLKKTGPTEILTVEGDDGERVQIWIE